MKLYGALLLALCCFAGASRAAPVNLATLTCVRYQNEVIAPPVPAPGTDSINTMMWLFGYSVGKSGAHVMYGDALAGFGFALDAECKNNPTESLLDALAKIKPDNKNPMDLNRFGMPNLRIPSLGTAAIGPRERGYHHDVVVWLRGCQEPAATCLIRAVFRTSKPRSWPTARNIPAAVFSTSWPRLNSRP